MLHNNPYWSMERRLSHRRWRIWGTAVLSAGVMALGVSGLVPDVLFEASLPEGLNYLYAGACLVIDAILVGVMLDDLSESKKLAKNIQRHKDSPLAPLIAPDVSLSKHRP